MYDIKRGVGLFFLLPAEMPTIGVIPVSDYNCCHFEDNKNASSTISSRLEISCYYMGVFLRFYKLFELDNNNNEGTGLKICKVDPVLMIACRRTEMKTSRAHLLS